MNVCTPPVVDPFEFALNAIANDMLLLGFIPALLFTVDYVILRPARRYEPWWRTPIGVMFAVLGLAITAVGGVVLASLFFGDYPLRPYLRLLAYGGFLVAMALLAIVYFAERNTDRPVLFRKREHHDRRNTRTDADA